MTGAFESYRIHRQAGRVTGHLESLDLSQLSEGDVVIRVSHSSINYKDALAATGAGPILKRFPLVGGIDLAGTVEQSSDSRYPPGVAVLVTGCGLSETRDGGYARYARVPAEAVVPLPSGLSAAAAMTIGTAGFSAALALMRMQQNGQTPALGPILVSGASGGVGSLAIDLLAAQGYEVSALTSKADAEGYLLALGAAQVLRRGDLQLGSRPLESARWGGAIDSVGGELLSWMVRSAREGGNVASIGLAGGGAQLNVSVMPFILRGVSVLGVNSATLPREQRLQVWQRLASDLKPRHLDRIATRQIGLAELHAAFDAYLSGRVIGRTLVHLDESWSS